MSRLCAQTVTPKHSRCLFSEGCHLTGAGRTDLCGVMDDAYVYYIYRPTIFVFTNYLTDMQRAQLSTNN